MKAVRLHQRGGPEQVVLDEVPIPAAGPGEVRIRVQAAALTPGELGWDETYRHPDGTVRLPTIPGHDVAGVIDAIGEAVTGVAVGQCVFGLVNFPLNGSAAEYVVLPATDVASAPASLDADHAAAVPLSGLTAWQGLFEHGQLKPGQRVLIHGAAGGVGKFAVQFARWAGARVTATTSSTSVSAVRALGADEVIDYGSSRFEDHARNMDLVFDTVGGDMLLRSPTVIRPGGRLVSIAAVPDKTLTERAGIAGVFFIVRPDSAQLKQIASLIDGGHVRVFLQEIFPLSRAKAAFERVYGGHLLGKVVLHVS